MPTVEQNVELWTNPREWAQRGDQWSKSWGGVETQWFFAIYPRIHSYVPAGTILEIAPGFGRWTEYLRRYSKQLIIVDLVGECIEACKARFASESHITYHVNDGKSLAMIADNSIDFVFSFDSLVHAEAQNNQLLPTPFLDIRSRVVSGGELGLLSVLFHPGYATNRRFFVNYTTDEGAGLISVVAEYHASPTNPNLADPIEFRILEVAQPFTNHKGGLNLFGPDGKLYIGFGDGGSAGDPFNNGQKLDTLLGKLLRIDVDAAAPYAVPPDNPFITTPGAKPEIWAYGFRNPWRFAFDRCDGRLFLGDVGQDAWEEVDLVLKGKNYGWRIMEGAHCFSPPTGCRTRGLELPIHEYSHAEGCSVIGGFVYRGRSVRGLAGRYIFADLCGPLWALTPSGSTWTRTELLQTGLSISSLGEDQLGELYVLDYSGSIYKVRRVTP